MLKSFDELYASEIDNGNHSRLLPEESQETAGHDTIPELSE